MPASRRARLLRIGGTPEALEVVEGALLGGEDVRHDGSGIDQDPAAVGVAFGTRDREAGRAGLRDDCVRDRARLDFRAAGDDDERIGNDGPAIEVQDRDILALFVFGGG